MCVYEVSHFVSQCFHFFKFRIFCCFSKQKRQFLFCRSKLHHRKLIRLNRPLTSLQVSLIQQLHAYSFSSKLFFLYNFTFTLSLACRNCDIFPEHSSLYVPFCNFKCVFYSVLCTLSSCLNLLFWTFP